MSSRFWHLAVIVVIFVLLALGSASLEAQAAPTLEGDHLALSGRVTNPQGGGVKEVEIEVLVSRSLECVGHQEQHFPDRQLWADEHRESLDFHGADFGAWCDVVEADFAG